MDSNAGVVTIDYFSDVLCVWAYGGQARLDEVRNDFGNRVVVRHRFMPLFADTATRIGDGWRDQGGFAGFHEHARELCERWGHVALSPSVWNRCRPTSCVTAHVFLKAVAITLGLDQTTADSDPAVVDFYEKLVADTRTAFFAHGHDISNLEALLDLLHEGPIPIDDVLQRMSDGEAYAALHCDEQLAKTYGVLGSPTYVFNEGRQLLYGNVGYRIIEANLRELLSPDHVEGEPNWC